MQAAEALASDGIAAEVIDLRVLRPLNDAAVRNCRAVIVDEGWRSGSLAAELAARMVAQASLTSTRHWRGCTLTPTAPALAIALIQRTARWSAWRSTAWLWRWLRRAFSSFVEGAPQTDLSAQFPR